MIEGFKDMPWQMWVYFGIGLVVAYWYQSRDGHPAREHGFRAERLVIFVLATMWPILLFAMLVNQPDKTKVRPTPAVGKNNTETPPGA